MKLSDQFAIARLKLAWGVKILALLSVFFIPILSIELILSVGDTVISQESQTDHPRPRLDNSGQVFLKELEKEWLTPWEERRGIETEEYHNRLILIHANIDEVAEVLAPAFTHWEPNVLSKPVKIGRRSIFIFQLQGHSWTELVSWDYADKLLAQQISAQINRPTLFYSIHDTDAPIEYTYFEAGQIVEQSTNTINDTRICYRASSKPLSHGPGNQCDVHTLFQTLDLLEPGIDFEYFFDHKDAPVGETITIQNPGFTMVIAPNRELKTTPTFERVDYFTDRQSLIQN